MKVNKKALGAKLVHIKMKMLSEHGKMMYEHLDAPYLRTRAKEEILSGGDLQMAVMLILMAELKDENGPKNSSK